MKYPKPLSPEEEAECFAEPRDIDKAVLYNMKAVVGRTKMACRKWQSLDYDDVFSELQMCLLRCVHKFNPDKHLKFSTYLNCSINDCIHELTKKQLRKNEILSDFGRSDPDSNDKDYQQKALGWIDHISLAEHADQARRRVWAEYIQDLLKENRAVLPPRDIYLIRAMFLSENPISLGEAAVKLKVEVPAIKTRVRRLLKKIKQGAMRYGNEATQAVIYLGLVLVWSMK